MLRATSLVVLLGVLGAGATALAQGGDEAAGGSLDAEARSLFEAGNTAYNDGRYESALEYFERAHELSGRPQLLYNIAQAADRLRQDEKALEALRGYRDKVPNAPNRAQVDSRIETLEAQLQRRAEAEAAAAPEAEPASEPMAEPEPAAPPPSDLDADLSASAATPAGARDDDGGLLSQWWFWTAAAVVVAGTVVGIALASSGDDTVAEPAPGTDGLVIVTLTQ